jgi:predicted GNAT family N-acyltransferase
LALPSAVRVFVKLAPASAARELGCVQVRLAAQLAATSVYRRAGFAVESEPFEEAGIQHVWMGQTLAQSDPAGG